MITTLLWDIDGTILNFLKAEKYAIKKCFEIFSLPPCTDEMIERYSKINKKYWEALEKGEMTKQEVLVGRFRKFFKSENIDFQKAKEFNLEYQLRLGDNVYFYENALNTLNLLKGKVKQYAVTNGTLRAQKRKLQNSGLDKIFDDVFISDEIGFEKPSIEFFNEVQKKIGKFDKNSTMIIGDSLSSDIRGGNNADILCCWFNPNRITNNKNLKIDYEITDLSEVVDIIKKAVK